MKLLPCPCGKTPDTVFLSYCGQGGKWKLVGGSCCGEWNIEFRTQYNEDGSAELLRLAVEAWNEAPRNTRAAPTDAMIEAGANKYYALYGDTIYGPDGEGIAVERVGVRSDIQDIYKAMIAAQEREDG